MVQVELQTIYFNIIAIGVIMILIIPCSDQRGLRLSTKTGLFPVQRVAKIVGSQAAAFFHFFFIGKY